MRLFVALNLPPEALDSLVALQARLPSGRPVAEENLHLTLAFLDDRRPGELEDLVSELDARPQPAFPVRVSGVGAFGGARPRSVHAVVAAEPGLSALHASVRRAAAAAGFPLPQRRFTPHVTLARFSPRAPAGPGLAKWLEKEAGFALPPFPAEWYGLYRSDLTSAGPIYSEMMRFPLDGAAPGAGAP